MKAPAILSRSRFLSHVSKQSQIEGAIGLTPRNEAGLKQFITAVTTPGSASYHHYLKKGEFARRFGPSAATIAAVRSALEKDRLQIKGVSSNHLLVSFSGSAGKVEAAFHTGLARYQLPNGKVGRATTRAVRLPASISSKVSVVTGLDNLVHPAPAGLVRASKAAAASHPAAKAAAVPHVAGAPAACANAQEAAAEYGGLTDDQIANAYGAFSLYKTGDTGQGQSVGIFELEPFASSDIAAFDQCYFGASAAAQMAKRLHVVPVDGGEPSGTGEGEAVLDVEDISALAPGANIDVYEAPNTTFGSLDEYNTMVSSDRDQVISSSWGLCEAAVQQGEPGFQQEENAIFEQAAAQGQSVFAAAGDNGSDDCNAFETDTPVSPVLSVDDPGSQPYVTSVGGTTITDATQPPAEQVWNDGAAWGAGGGGISQSWVMPSWQAAARVPGVDPQSTITTAEQVERRFDSSSDTSGDFCAGNNSSGSTYGGSNLNEPCREVPDVSAQADEFTGAVTIYSSLIGPGPYGWATIGGTSSATPIWAALLTDIDASPTCQSNNATSSGVGFVSPLLYAVASNPTAYKASFHDITTGNNDMYGLAGGAVFPATTGYDMASGLGSPQLAGANGSDGLAYYLCSYAVKATRPAISSISPSVIDTGSSSGPITITGTGFESGGTSQVAKLWLNNVLLPSGDYTVNSATSITLTTIPAEDLVPTAGVADGAGRVDVAVSLTDGETSAITANSVLQAVDTTGGNNLPAVTGLASYGGSQAGGNTVKILGSGFTGATGVTFGGVAATSYHVISPYEISAVVPPYSSHNTDCATAPTLNPSNDICQTEVVVSNGSGSSTQYQILPSYEGAVTYNANGVVPAPTGCGCEAAPAPSEYDYVPAPRITGVSTSGGPADYADENGPTTVTITGSGFNYFTLSSLLLGPANQYTSLVTNLSYVSGTEIQFVANPRATTLNAVKVPVTVESLGGKSNTPDVTYAGVPSLDTLSVGAAPSSGGTTVLASGAGLADLQYALLIDAISPFSVGTSYKLTPEGSNKVYFTTPQLNPGLDEVSLCTTSGCSNPTKADTMVIYPPGRASVTATSPKSGPAHGGTPVIITGNNLGCIVNVAFGNESAETYSNAQALLDCGSSTEAVVLAPPGKAGTTVPIRVETVEGIFTGSGFTKAVTTARFTYHKSSPTAPDFYRCRPGGQSVQLAWRPPSDNGGSPVKHYVVRATAPGFPQHAVMLKAKARSYVMKHLSPGVKWRIMVTAHNASGIGLSAVRFVTPRY